MNETALPATNVAATSAAPAATTSRRKTGSLQLYVLLSLLIVLGWLLRDYRLINPEAGVGYWLGIVGGSVMLALLLYPVRKRIRWLHRLGATRHWFKMHMVLGLVGPLLILYHCNFSLGSFNSQVALYCMLFVAGSGIIGRHFYAAIHRGLYGRKTSLRELQGELANSVEHSHGLAKLMPNLVARLDKLSAELQGDSVRESLGIGRSLHWTLSHVIVRWSLLSTARKDLRAAAITNRIVGKNYKRLYGSAKRYVREYTVLSGRIAQFSFYERLFGLWHVLHLPIFFMMILSALVHVLAVHMY